MSVSLCVAECIYVSKCVFVSVLVCVFYSILLPSFQIQKCPFISISAVSGKIYEACYDIGHHVVVLPLS